METENKILYPLYLNYKNPDFEDRDLKDLCTYYHDPYNLPKNEYPIEKVTHHFWLKTHKKTIADKELSDKNIHSLLNQYSMLNYEQKCSNIEYYFEKETNTCPVQNYYELSKFNHFFWVNDEKLYPQTVKKLEAIGVEVKNIQTLADKYPYIDQINEYIDKAYYGSMVDTLKYATVFNYGGVAVDLNFKFYTSNLEKFFDSYSFIAMKKTAITDYKIENFFVAAHSSHSVINKILANIEQIFNDYDNLDCHAEHFKGPCNDTSLTQITFLQSSAFITSNIENNKNEVNEVFVSNCWSDNNLEIGTDGVGVGQTWKHEKIID